MVKFGSNITLSKSRIILRYSDEANIIIFHFKIKINDRYTDLIKSIPEILEKILVSPQCLQPCQGKLALIEKIDPWLTFLLAIATDPAPKRLILSGRQKNEDMLCGVFNIIINRRLLNI